MLKSKSKIPKKLFLSCLLISFVIYSTAQAVEYDGIWFLGFNLKSPVFKNLVVRQAVNQSIDKKYIAKDLISQEALPVSLIPPTMLGYDPDLKAKPYNIKQAKDLMQKAGFPISDTRLKSISLLHTDGVKTIAAAQAIRKNLQSLGLQVKLVKVKYEDQEQWVADLVAGKYDLFLMGYKAGIEQMFSTDEATASQIDTYNLLQPLFATKGEANFTSYSKANVDDLLSQVAGINIALKSDRNAKFKKINRILYQDLPVIVLFYIEKL